MNIHRLRSYLLLAADNGAGTGAPAEPADPAPAADPHATPSEGGEQGGATSEPAAPKEGEGKPDASAKKGIFAKAGDYLTARGELLKKISGHEEEITRLRGELETANKTMATQASELQELRDGKASLEQSIARLEKEQQTTSEAAADLVAGQGVPAGKLPPVSDEAQDVAASDAEHLEKYGRLKGSEKTAYFRANKEAINRAAKARAKK